MGRETLIVWHIYKRDIYKVFLLAISTSWDRISSSSAIAILERILTLSEVFDFSIFKKNSIFCHVTGVKFTEETSQFKKPELLLQK